MTLQTFRASSMSEALRQVKGVMGGEAVILHTRTFHVRHWLGLRRREVVEITAGPPQAPSAQRPASRSRTNRVAPLPITPPANGRPAAAAPHPALPPRPAPASPPPARRSVLDTPVAGNAALIGVSQEVAQLKAAVGELVRQARKNHASRLPEPLLDAHHRLVETEVAEEIATDLLRGVADQARPEQLADPAFVRARLAEQIERIVPVAGEIRRTRPSGPHVVALVGPTGVGKTTTIAKLAANLKLRGKHQVGLITLDNYRIAAVDQLRKYAEIIGAPLKTADNAQDLVQAVASLADCHFILLDTAGRSPNDADHIAELKRLLATASPDEVHLVLSATAGPQAMQRAVGSFAEVGFDKLVFTKLDEAAGLGCLLGVIRRLNKRLSYVTTGQGVPDDIEPANARRLADRILDGHCRPDANGVRS